MPRLALPLVAILTVACATPTSDATRPTPTATAPAKATPPPSKPEPPKPEPPEPVPPKLGRDHRSVVACTTDHDCGWDDACMPTRCVEPPTTPAACEETAPPPGTCTCLEGACTTHPTKSPPPTGTCETRGCMVDRAAGRCVADTGGIPEGIRATPGIDVGPSCDCTPAGCAFTWFDAVPCKTDRDCWIEPSPRLHPILRPKALRGRDFAPCRDGEVAPKCGPAGQCVLGAAYKC